MRITARHLLIALSVCGLAVGGFAAHDWYDKHYIWPREIQQQLFGGMLAPPDSLIDYKGFEDSSGDGGFVWRYKVDPTSELLAKLCQEQPIEDCSFAKTSMPSETVLLGASYENGVLTLQEGWL